MFETFPHERKDRPMDTILVVDDERDITDLVAYNLNKAGFKSDKAHDGAEALRLAQARPPRLVILDLMLPGMDGLEVCRRLRAEARTRSVPILMLTAKGEETDKVVGLEVGADDYLTKPFSPRELVARVRALLRRAKPSDQPMEAARFEVPGLSLDESKHEVLVKGKPVELTAKEFSLLAYLGTRPGRVVTRDTLLDQVWGMDSDVETRTVDVHMRRLREKLGAAAQYLGTVRGVGYKFKEG
jgi:two-component system phosphate regulon response regulator PhoB